VVEHPDTVAEQDGRDEHDDLVEHTRFEALPGDLGTKDTDVLVACGGVGRGDGAVAITDEGAPGTGVSAEHLIRCPIPASNEPAAQG
jgi:hypothetical protein